MEIDEDFESYSPTEAPSSPSPKRKLKRLKRATTMLQSPASVGPLDSAKSNIGHSEELNLETLDINSQDLEESDSEIRYGSEAFAYEKGLDAGAGGLGLQEKESGAKRALDLDFIAEEFEGRNEDRQQDDAAEMDKESGHFGVEEPEKKRRSFDMPEEKKVKKKRAKNVRDDDKPKSAAVSKRRADKERRENLKQLRAESQRLLRDTRDAAFKSVPLVQKPISSVLEKIRKRKLEVSKKSVKLSKTSSIDDDDEYLSREIMADADFKNSHTEERKDDEATKLLSEAISASRNLESRVGAVGEHASNNAANDSIQEGHPAQMAEYQVLKQTFRAPIDDTQDLFSDSQTSRSKDELPDESPNSPHEVTAPSVLAMNLRLDSAPPDDISSDEEDNDKENLDPSLCGSDELSSSPHGDPVKAFVDVEAEEEDDGDNDLLRFQDNEEDEENEDEELKDMIETQYEEKPIDIERRNELHQKWLEQQDTAGTERLLQRYKYGSKQMEATLLDEGDIEESEEENEEYGYEAADNVGPTNMRMNLKKVKEMIPLMFTEKDDPYVSSDDEETERSLVKQCFFEKSERQGTFLSPAEDKDTREVFGLIKKLNIVPDTKKKAKPSALADLRLIGGKKTVFSKSSFLGRASNHSLPSSHKHGSGVVRSFIFEREDSNSRRAVSMSEGSSNMVQRENRPVRTASTRVYSSQVRSCNQKTKAMAETNSGNALLEILRRSSLQSGHCTQDSVVSHTESVLATFKVEKTIKKERNVSIGTL